MLLSWFFLDWDFLDRIFLSDSFGGPLAEFLYPPGFINKFLLAGIEGMASRTDFSRNVFYRGAGFYHIATGAGDLSFGIIFWVNVFFHI